MDHTVATPTRHVETGDTIIEARQLVKRFDEMEAVKGVDFAISRGESFGLPGPRTAPARPAR